MERGILVLAALSCVFGIALAAENSCGDCLILTPYIKNGSAALARQLSEVNSSNFLDYRSHAGFITVKKEYNSNLFFWFFPAATDISETPLIIWLQGGPGFSSMKGLFDIVGPIKVENGTVAPRNVSWADHSLLFLDNPVGAGFSFTDDEDGYPDNEDDVGEQMLEFLKQFLEMFPELRSAPLFVIGESYAGKYVPALAIQIHRHNEEDKGEDINLKGIAIGNALVELRNMMHYSTMCEVLGILEGHQIDHLETLEKQVVKLIDSTKMVDAANKFNETIEYIKKQSGVSIYNFVEEPSSGAPEFEEFINRSEVRKQIHVGNATFDYNNQLVYEKMLPDFANSTKPFVEELLEHYGVLSYSGQLDIILGYSLSKHMYETLRWSRRESYAQAPRRRLRRYANGSVVGYRKAGGNFVDVLIRGAGHMVPVDQPDVAKFIIDSFIEEFK
nr:venom serine carboxypeptidase [Helicoverpa armigera]